VTVPFRPTPMSQDEVEMHKRTAQKLIAEGTITTPAQLQAYADSVGIPQKKKIDYSPGITPDFILGAARSALHGASFGFDDEAVGSLYGLVTGVGAQVGRDTYRAQLQAFHDQNPGTDLGMQIAGGIASGGGAVAGAKALAPKALAWLASMPGVIKAVGSAGLGGAAFGAGDATGGVAERLPAAARGGATGAVFGAGATGALKAAGAVIKPLAKNLPILKKAYASAGETADDVILRDLESDGAKVQDLIDKARINASRGQLSSLPDLAGENTVGRMAGIQSIPGKGKQDLKTGLVDRQMGSGDRIMDWLSGTSKVGLGNIEKVRNGLLGARALHAEGLYDDAYQQAAPMTDRLKAVFSNPLFKRAYNEARLELRERKGIDVPPLTSKPFLPDETEVFPPSLPVAGLDWMKRYLDKQVRAGFKGQSGWDHSKAQGLAEQLAGVLDEVDELVPQYGLARKTYRGDSEVIDALDMGRKWGTEKADVIALKMTGFKSDAEREAAKLGLIEDIRDMIYNKKSKAPDVATTVLGGKEMARRLQAAFGPEADDFLTRVRTEARFAETLRGAASGSRTTPLAKVIEDFEQQSAGVMGNLLANRPGLALVTAARAGGLALRQSHTEQVAEELSKRYTYGLDDPAELIGYLINLQSRVPRPNRTPRIAAVLGGQAAASE
jgi:hypothetical protein